MSIRDEDISSAPESCPFCGPQEIIAYYNRSVYLII